MLHMLLAAVLTILHGVSTDDKRTGTASNQDPRINLGPRFLGFQWQE